jgi:hypothetical protein
MGSVKLTKEYKKPFQTNNIDNENENGKTYWQILLA